MTNRNGEKMVSDVTWLTSDDNRAMFIKIVGEDEKFSFMFIAMDEGVLIVPGSDAVSQQITSVTFNKEGVFITAPRSAVENAQKALGYYRSLPRVPDDPAEYGETAAKLLGE